MSSPPSNRSQHRDFIDERLFVRLYNGNPGPLTISLQDGRQLIGEVKGIIRRRNVSAAQTDSTILLITTGGEIELNYATIADIS